jgi:hypothetical protein
VSLCVILYCAGKGLGNSLASATNVAEGLNSCKFSARPMMLEAESVPNQQEYSTVSIIRTSVIRHSFSIRHAVSETSSFINNSACSAMNNTLSARIFYILFKVKSLPPPLTRRGGALGERRYSSYALLTSALKGGEWLASRPGRALLLQKQPPVPIVQEAGWAPEPVCTPLLGIEHRLSSP